MSDPARDALAEHIADEVDRLGTLDLAPDDRERLLIGVDLAVTGTAVLVYARAANGTITLVNVPPTDVAFLGDLAARLATGRACPPAAV